MSDIKTLSIDLKAAALKAKSDADEWGYDTDAFHDVATPDAVIELVEALEEAKRSNSSQDDHINQQQPVAVVEPSDYVTAAQLVDEGPGRKAVHELYEGALRIGDKLYRHAQPVQVPDELLSAMEEVLRISARDHEFWHKAKEGIAACRAAMLSNEPVSNRDELRENIRREHADWSQSTFGNVGPVGPLKHLSKEAIEAAEAPDDLSEWADMQFLLWDAQRRAGITDEQITQAMIEKMAINKARIWPEPKDGEPRLHIKAAQLPEVKGE